MNANSKIKNKMDLINYLSEFHNFLWTEKERKDYINVLMILKDNHVIEENNEDEQFIILCVRKFLRDFMHDYKLMKENLGDKRIINSVSEPKKIQKIDNALRNDNDEPINYKTNINNSNNSNVIIYLGNRFYTVLPSNTEIFFNDNIKIEKKSVIKNGSYLGYENLREFYEWVLTLKPRDVRGKGISDRGLRNVKRKIRMGNGLKNRSKISMILFEQYLKSDKEN